MIALRAMFATLMAVLAVGSYAQTDSSSSTGVVADSSSADPSLSSSSSGPVVPGFNESSSSSVWVMPSSSTGSDSPSFFPPGTQEVTYMVELASGTVNPLLANALASDFAATVVDNPTSNLNVTAEAILPFIRIRIQDPSTNETIGPANTTVVAIVLGNVTNVLVIGEAHDLAVSFANAAQNGSVVVTESAVFGVDVFPQTVVIVESPMAESSTGVDDGGNGASSVASASLLIGSMITALALAF